MHGEPMFEEPAHRTLLCMIPPNTYFTMLPMCSQPPSITPDEDSLPCMLSWRCTLLPPVIVRVDMSSEHELEEATQLGPMAEAQCHVLLGLLRTVPMGCILSIGACFHVLVVRTTRR